ncbi:MAG TPA: phosphoribosylformylglycinamidine cyclo-ligase [Candidatus Binataceae bacterium]|nr:phosphoribosylformylglycinamidine cyclo-ligase [Candidatus Binataceae bacterium]
MAFTTTYKDAGVDIELKESLIPTFRKIARRTKGARVLGGVGGFGALVAFDAAKKMRSPVLISGTDGVGTKLKIAQAVGRHDTIGIDCVAMCVNDIICHAAKPLFFLDYIGTGKLEREVAVQIVEGVARGCALAGISLVGGETAQLGDVYQPGEYDLAGFAVGVAERSSIPNPKKIRPGDVLIGLASSGLHSNGYSLVRKVIAEREVRLRDRSEELGCTLADELLRPTTIYAKIAGELFTKHHLKGLANITGGGVPENLPRVLPEKVQAVVERGSWPIPPIFGYLQQLGAIEQAEMDRTFNNGLGMIAIVARDDADLTMKLLKRRKIPAYVVGEVRRGTRSAILK